MIDSLIKRYIWLIQTIRDAGENGIPFSEIQNKWDKASANDNHTPLISRTFHNHRNAILLQFSIEIKCNMSRENSYYYIAKSDLEGNTIVTWLINSIQDRSFFRSFHKHYDKTSDYCLAIKVFTSIPRRTLKYLLSHSV